MLFSGSAWVVVVVVFSSDRVDRGATMEKTWPARLPLSSLATAHHGAPRHVGDFGVFLVDLFPAREMRRTDQPNGSWTARSRAEEHASARVAVARGGEESEKSGGLEGFAVCVASVRDTPGQ